MQFGQNSFTVSNPGKSERPQGTTLQPLQYTRGHEPKIPASYLSTCIVVVNHMRTGMYGISHSPSPAILLLSECISDDRAHTEVLQTPPRLIHRVFWTCLRLVTVVLRGYDETTRGNATARTWLHVQHHLHRLLPKWHHGIESCQVEIILDEVLGDLAEVFVSWERAEPADPSQSRRRRRGACTRHIALRSRGQMWTKNSKCINGVGH